MRRIKFIWDFRGPGALQTARHHRIHLDEFCESENIPDRESGIEEVNSALAIAYLVAPESHLTLIRDRLRPHRAVLA